jgi:hypothetical protein
VWKAPLGTAVTAAMVNGSKINISTATTGTGLDGSTLGTGLYVYKVATADSPTSAIYCIFASVI